MSKQKRGMFRRMIDVGRKLLGKPVTHHYDDPVVRQPVGVQRAKKSRQHGEERLQAALPCEPGTIAFHDKCVRYYGRRKAEVIRRNFQHKDKFGHHDRLDRIPTGADFAALTPWAWRAQ